MATTMFFEETLRDRDEPSRTIDIEFGRSSFYGDNLIYLNVEGKGVILDQAMGRKLCEAMRDLAGYLGYDR